MKLLKGNYETILRTHENYRCFAYERGDYFLQYDNPNNYFCSLYLIVESEYDEEEDDIKKIATLRVEDANKMSCKELKELISK